MLNKTSAFHGVLLPLTLLYLAPMIVHSAVLNVPSEYTTIQSAIDAASNGDIVQVADGTYSGEGFRWVDFSGKAITVRSENGPESCIVDLAGEQGFLFEHGEGRGSVLEGLTITRGYIGDWHWGAGIWIYASSPAILNCVLISNTASQDTPAGGLGGGIGCWQGSPLIEGCTIAANSASFNPPHPWAGGGIYATFSSHLDVRRTVLWGNCWGDLALADGSSTATLTCCVVDSSGAGGAGQIFYGEGNVFSNPLFCTGLPCPHGSHNPFDYRVDAVSPCLPGNNPCGVLVGALGVGCPAEGVPQIAAGSGQSSLIRLIGPAPNPGDGRLMFTLTLARPSWTRISVDGVTGRRLRLISDGLLGPGEHSFNCSLLSGEQGELSSGVYYLRVQTGAYEETRSFGLIR